ITEILRFPRSKEGTSYTVPDTVTVIGTYAFQLSDLTEIVLHNGITEIKQGAFLACFDLTSITLPSSLEKIGIQALSYCQGLSSITIPDGVTEIDTRAFSDSTGLNYVVIPESVTTIGDDILRNCEDVIIYGVVGSYAQTYAEENGITFADIDGGIVDPGKLAPGAAGSGDLDGDGEIGITDIIAVAKLIHNQISLTEDAFAAADINSDNAVNAIDLSIVKYLLLH
ncbi:MAG: leucine-rich repeat protein, partial [Ruminococcus sp.]|nr:leucine-rich repeat protein [Ruminococcus sp.]